MSSVHKPVLLHEVIDALQIKPGGRYIDATFGGGGHSQEILNRGGVVLGLDQDPEAILRAQENFKTQISNLKLKVIQNNFRNIKSLALENGFEKVSGILFDLGLSSDQLDNSGRGFTFRKDEPLDMRMDNKSALNASDIINTWSESELYELFAKLGEESNSLPIVQNIIKTRKRSSITTTGALVKSIEEVTKGRGKIHPATRVFMALRIAVNDELEVLKEGIGQAYDLLEGKGRIVIITFHSLEDRIVKIAFKDMEEKGLGTVITKKPIISEKKETMENKRARSAKLRVFEKYEKN